MDCESGWGGLPCPRAGSGWGGPRQGATWGSLRASGRSPAQSGRPAETLLVWDAYWVVGLCDIVKHKKYICLRCKVSLTLRWSDEYVCLVCLLCVLQCAVGDVV